MIRLLRSLCGSCGILPASYTLEGEVTITGRDLSPRMGNREIIFPGTWRSEKVAVKLVILREANPREKKKVCVMVPM